ncbi:MAG: sialidase family protein [Ferruginibacter sp.]
MKNIIGILLLVLSVKANAQNGPTYEKVPGVPIVHAPKSTGIHVGTPSIIILSNGDYIASHDMYGDPIKPRRLVRVFLSKDKGKTWQFRAQVDNIHWAGLFAIHDTVYLLGREGVDHGLAITRSYDSGKTWDSLSILKERKSKKDGYHGSSTPVVFANGRVYKGYDHLYPDDKGKWMSNNRSFIMSAAVTDNLMDPKSWTYSNSIDMPDSIDGTGWLETNAVLGRDGKIKGVVRVAGQDGMHAGFYSLESNTRIDSASVRKIDFIGGATKFNVMWDASTKKYWSLANYPATVLRQYKKSSGGMRCILALTYSEDLVNWKIKSLVLATEDVNFHAWQYVDWQFEGKDIVFVSRTAYDDGEGGAANYHDANYISFHRIENYSESKTPKAFEYLLAK